MWRLFVVLSALVVFVLPALSVMAEDITPPAALQSSDDSAVMEAVDDLTEESLPVVADKVVDAKIDQVAEHLIRERKQLQQISEYADTILVQGGSVADAAEPRHMAAVTRRWIHIDRLRLGALRVASGVLKVINFVDPPVIGPSSINWSIPNGADEQRMNADAEKHEREELNTRRAEAETTAGALGAAMREELRRQDEAEMRARERADVQRQEEAARLARAQAQRAFDEVIRQAEETRRREAERKAQQARDFESALDRMEQQQRLREQREAAAERARAAAEARAAANAAIRERNAKRLERLQNGENVIRKAGDRL